MPTSTLRRGEGIIGEKQKERKKIKVGLQIEGDKSEYCDGNPMLSDLSK